MPHKTHRSHLDFKTRSKKDKCVTGLHPATPTCKRQDNLTAQVLVHQPTEVHDNHAKIDSLTGLENLEDGSATAGKGPVVTDTLIAKSHSKKKKKHITQNTTVVKSGLDPPSVKEENGGKHKAMEGKIDLQPFAPMKLDDDAVKRRRLSENKFGKMVSSLESKVTKTEVPVVLKREEAKAGVDMTQPRVVEVIQAEAVSGDPLSLRLWCQFSTVFDDHTITWSREGTTLSELKRSGEDESRVSVTISKASRQDLGKYECVLTSLHGRLSLDYLLTYEASPLDIVGNQENVHCSWLLFKEDFLSQQCFGENQAASIITEAVHFGEGMHRRAFRTKLQAGEVPQLEPGNTCVLKVHNSISYGTKNNQELVQKNFDLAVEECQVQNTAREYIKAYTTVAQSAEAFGEVPEIIPIYLVHRPSNDVPYATLEEELLGDFVKYSVRDGKEINLTRRDSEAGQKCCAFQHWVYNKTEGNLLVTDMQGQGNSEAWGYKGFRGNCATSFIDQFKALHMCNKYCELLGLASLQPKPKKPSSKPKPKPPPSTAANPKKKVFGPTVKGNSR
ncbi:hypothetical protein CRUP_032370 [Coryphaenoides rupestris]|nr:hypothetical protein CRUP_032370 [Coryphaenoides rupestris]